MKRLVSSDTGTSEHSDVLVQVSTEPGNKLENLETNLQKLDLGQNEQWRLGTN